MDFVWEKPVIIFYKERIKERERRAFAVVKATKLEIEAEGDTGLKGRIQGFFPLMGDIDYVSSEEGMADRYKYAGLRMKRMISAELGGDSWE